MTTPSITFIHSELTPQLVLTIRRESDGTLKVIVERELHEAAREFWRVVGELADQNHGHLIIKS